MRVLYLENEGEFSTIDNKVLSGILSKNPDRYLKRLEKKKNSKLVVKI